MYLFCQLNSGVSNQDEWCEQATFNEKKMQIPEYKLSIYVQYTLYDITYHLAPILHLAINYRAQQTQGILIRLQIPLMCGKIERAYSLLSNAMNVKCVDLFPSN